MWIGGNFLGPYLLHFVRRGGRLLRCSDASDRVAAALLGRFLPRLGPLAPLAALFLLARAAYAIRAGGFMTPGAPALMAIVALTSGASGPGIPAYSAAAREGR